jgi:signal transduction histidine kinase/CheY-like chemotaxis protein
MTPHLSHQYTPGLVVLSVCLAVMASYAAIDMAGRVFSASPRTRHWWILGGGAAMGNGIWSMHFMGMLAMELPVRTHYDAALVAASAILAVLASTIALWLAGRQQITKAQTALAALVMGVAVAGMHFVGMQSLEVDAYIEYDVTLVTLAVAIAIVASYAMLSLTYRHRAVPRSRAFRVRAFGSATLLGVSIAAMHYTAMAAATFRPLKLQHGSDVFELPPAGLAIGVALACATLCGLGLIAGLFDRIVTARTSEAEARVARDAAEETSRLKSEFLATMSHEIRTPMNGVLGMIGIALDTRLSKEQRNYLETAKTSAEALLVVLNDILDFSKIEAGKMEIEPIAFDLSALLEEVVELLSTRAHDKGLELVLRVPPSAPARLVGDPGRIRQVVLNLVGNGIKFTEHGHVFVEVTPIAVGESSADIRISVRDTGIGIPLDRQAMLFQKFTQADNSTTRRFGGTGLGLAISRRLIELMGGTLTVESRPFGGSTFSFTLSLPIDFAAPAMPLPVGDLNGVRVLIVDDLPVNRTILAEQTSSWGMRPDVADSAGGARRMVIEAVRAGDPYRVVLLDYLMPDEDGAQFGRSMLANPYIGRLDMILLSSAAPGSQLDAMKDAGFTGYFVKPVRPAILRDALVAICGSIEQHVALPSIITRHTLEEINGESPSGAQRRLAPKVMTGSGKRALLVEDNPVNQIVAVKLLERVGWCVTVANNGRIAVDKFQPGEYDVVLMDIEMPEMDGITATARIREIEGPHMHTPIIAMTATVMVGDRERCLSAGMDDYVPKPIVVQDLYTVLERWSHAGLSAA